MKLSLVITIVVGIIHCQEVLGCLQTGGSGGSGGGGSGSSKLCFKQICSSNPSNQIRGCDRQGCGNFGAPRGSRAHQGIDIVCTAGSSIYAPFPVKMIGISKPYGYGHAYRWKDFNTGIYMSGTGSWIGNGSWKGFEVKMWYVAKYVSDGMTVYAGSFIGVIKDRAAASPGMTNHVHVQLYKDGRIVDPTFYVC